MPRVFAFVPVGTVDKEFRRVVRFGFTNTNKRLDELCRGLNAPKIILLEEQVENGKAGFDKLQNIMRGNIEYAPGARFRWMSHNIEPDFYACLLGYNWFETPFTEEELRTKFARIAQWFHGGVEEEKQPPVALQGEPGPAVAVGAHVEHMIDPEQLVASPLTAAVERLQGEQLRMVQRPAEQLAAMVLAPLVQRLQEDIEITIVQPGEGGQMQMRSMSSAQAAAIICGVPGSIEDVLQN